MTAGFRCNSSSATLYRFFLIKITCFLKNKPQRHCLEVKSCKRARHKSTVVTLTRHPSWRSRLPRSRHPHITVHIFQGEGHRAEIVSIQSASEGRLLVSKRATVLLDLECYTLMMLQQRQQQRQDDLPHSPSHREFELFLTDHDPESQKPENFEDDEAYRLRVEEAKRICRQRRYCTYVVLTIYLIIFLMYLRRRKGES
jgi:hypothetical protein